MGNEIQRWADKAMFAAEPMPEEVRARPRVHLLQMTADPLGVVAAVAKMYKGEVVRSLSEVTHRERREYFEEMQKTLLAAPFEFVQFHFMIEGVTRAFTHQLVRQRTATYAQESMRFAVKESIDEEVMIPPSLVGLPADHPRRVLWRQAINKVEDTYHALIADGVPAEDARGLLPTNIKTRVHYRTDLRALISHAGNRLCTQAQFEWRLVFTAIREAIRNYNPEAHLETWQQSGTSDVWQYEAISELFRPVCYLTGKCEFKANFDRSCKIRDRVDKNEAHNRPSSEWGESVIAHNDESPKTEVVIPLIRPEEWLLDPGAAR